MKRILIWPSIYVILMIGLGCSTSPGPDNKASGEPSGNQTQSSVGEPNTPDTTIPSGSFQVRDKRKNRVDANPNTTPEPLVFRPAPENSATATTMTADGSVLEIRVFKGHPQLAKVEVTWTHPNDKSVKVYLKNGTAVDAKTDRMGNLRTTSSIEIMQVAGIRAVGRNPAPSRLVDKK